MSKVYAEQRIVIIGASAGGMQALTTLIAQLPGDLRSLPSPPPRIPFHPTSLDSNVDANLLP